MGLWGLGPIPNPQSPIPNPQSPIPNPQSPIPKLIVKVRNNIKIKFLNYFNFSINKSKNNNY
jgi:hypothetical protein